MTTQTTVSTSTLPRVNLLPDEISEARRARAVQAGLGAVVVLALLAVGGLWMHGRSSVSSAQADLDRATATNAQLQQQVTRYQGVTAFRSQAQAQEQQLQQALGNEVLWSHYLTDLSLNLPGNVWLTNLNIAPAAAGAGGATGPGAAAGNVGQLTLQGQALSHDDVASLLDALAGEKGFANPFFTQSQETPVSGTSKVTDQFNVTADITPDVLCGTVCLDSQVGG